MQNPIHSFYVLISKLWVILFNIIDDNMFGSVVFIA